MMSNNYTKVTLPCTTNKILANILYIKLVPYTKEITGEYKGGFKREWSTADQIFAKRQILKKCWKRCTLSIYCFTSTIWQCMEKGNMDWNV